MSINKYDDYEKLAKVLYPSIEASGNVYYGQTRKLTMDEILGKNNVNFESHIETITTEESSDSSRNVIRKSYFCWKLGPLHGSFLCSTVTERFNGATSISVEKDKLLNDDFGFNGQFLSDADCHIIEFDGSELDGGIHPNMNHYGTLFAKYKLNLNQITVENIINSGVYNSYENNVSCEFCYPVLTNNTDPSKPLAYNIYNISDRSFYIKYENDEIYLYVQIATANMYDGESADKPLTIVSCEDNNIIYFEIDSNTAVGQEYEFITNVDDQWADLTNWQGTFNKGGYVSIRRKDGGEPAWCRLSMWSDKEIKAYNNANSVLAKDFVNLDDLTVVNNGGTINPALVENGLFGYLFQTNIHLTKMPILPSSVLPAYAYSNLFKDCKWLDVSILPATTLSDASYQSMFMNVNYLTRGPKLPATACSVNSYMNMFYNYGVSFVGVQSNIKVNGDGEDIATSNWLGRDEDEQVGGGILICQSNAPLELNSTSGIPTGWQKITYDPDKDDDYENIVISVPHNGYNVRQHLVECNSDNSQCYKPYDYIVASGSDSDRNGRGYILSNTEFNMANRDEINTINPGTYNYEDGSYNQEIWGYKWFNSPVIFKNGIYGERSYITTDRSEIHYNHNASGEIIPDEDDYSDNDGIYTSEGSRWVTNGDSDYAYTSISDTIYTHIPLNSSDRSEWYSGCKAVLGVYLDGDLGNITINGKRYSDDNYSTVNYDLTSTYHNHDTNTISGTHIFSMYDSENNTSIIALEADEININAQSISGNQRFSDTVVVEGRLLANGETVCDDDVTVNGNVHVADDLLPTENNVSGLGNSDYPFHDAYISTITNNLFFTNNIHVGPVTEQTNPPSIGNSTAPFNVGYINTLHGDLVGKIPFPSIEANTLSLPVGGICLAYIVNVDFGYDDMTGRQFTIPSGSTNYKSVVFNGSGVPSAGSYSLPSGTYTCLGGGRSGSSVGSFMILVMRIAN